MEIIEIHHPINNQTKFADPIVLAMGFFDGVHLGHQKVIKAAVNKAKERGIKSAVLTYDHHPQMVYGALSPHDRRYLTLPNEKMKLIEQLGIDKVFLINYSYAFQDQTPQEFVDNYIVRFNAEEVVAGFDHTYGAGKEATMEQLSKYANGRFQISIIPPLELREQKVSSTSVKEKLDVGDVKTVQQLLGRPFSINGPIVHGEQVGRTIGFPTINVAVDPLKWLPGIGIYVTKVKIGDNYYQGMASIGKNVTFYDDHPVTIEINLLDFNQNVYGENVTIYWLDWLRGEVKFADVDELIDQLKLDETATRRFFANN